LLDEKCPVPTPLIKKFVKDPRRGPDYSIDSLLMFCLCNHLFRMPSKNKFHLNFKKMTGAKAIAKFCGFDVERSPCARTTDYLLQHLNPEDFSSILPAIFRDLCRHKVFQLHPEFIPLKEFAGTIDAQATHTYHDQSQHPGFDKLDCVPE